MRGSDPPTDELSDLLRGFAVLLVCARPRLRGGLLGDGPPLLFRGPRRRGLRVGCRPARRGRRRRTRSESDARWSIRRGRLLPDTQRATPWRPPLQRLASRHDARPRLVRSPPRAVSLQVTVGDGDRDGSRLLPTCNSRDFEGKICQISRNDRSSKFQPKPTGRARLRGFCAPAGA